MNKTERIEQNNYYALLLRKRYMQLLSFTEYFPEDSMKFVLPTPYPTFSEYMKLYCKNLFYSIVGSFITRLTFGIMYNWAMKRFAENDVVSSPEQ